MDANTWYKSERNKQTNKKKGKLFCNMNCICISDDTHKNRRQRKSERTFTYLESMINLKSLHPQIFYTNIRWIRIDADVHYAFPT